MSEEAERPVPPSVVKTVRLRPRTEYGRNHSDLTDQEVIPEGVRDQLDELRALITKEKVDQRFQKPIPSDEE